MKKTLRVSIPFLTVLIFAACSPSPDEAVTYNNYIVQQLDKVQMADSVVAAMEKDKAVMDATQKNLVSQLNTSIENIKKNGGFDKTTDLMDAALQYLDAYKSVVDSVYSEMIAINSKPLEKLTEEDDTRYKTLQELCNTKMIKVSDRFDSIQHAFSAKYKFEIEGASSSKKQ